MRRLHFLPNLAFFSNECTCFGPLGSGRVPLASSWSVAMSEFDTRFDVHVVAGLGGGIRIADVFGSQSIDHRWDASTRPLCVEVFRVVAVRRASMKTDLFALSDRCRHEKHCQFAMNSAIFVERDGCKCERVGVLLMKVNGSIMQNVVASLRPATNRYSLRRVRQFVLGAPRIRHWHHV